MKNNFLFRIYFYKFKKKFIKITLLTFFATLFFILSSFSFADDFTQVSFSVLSKETKLPVENVSISIGDLKLSTNKSGIATSLLFPATYEITFFKNNYISFKKNIEITTTKNQFVFYIESNFIPIRVQIIDDFNNDFLKTSIKVINLTDNTFSFFTTNKKGILNIKIKKNKKYKFNIKEKNYKEFNYNLTPKNLLSSDFLFKLSRLKGNLNISTSLDNYKIKITSLENKSYIKEFETKNKIFNINLPYGKYNVELNSDNYKSATKFFDFYSNEKTINLKFIPNFKFFNFITIFNQKSNILITANSSLDKLEIANNSTIKLFNLKNELINSFKIEDKFYKIKLNYGIYNIEVSNNIGKNVTFKKIELSENSDSNIFLSLQKLEATITGTIKDKNNLIGGAVISFINNENKFSTTSDIDGTFTIKVPAIKYNITIFKSGYRISKNQNLTINYLESNKKYKLNFSIEEIPSIIKGVITHLNGEPIDKAKITLRNNSEEKYFFTNKKGEYSAEINSGLIFIKVEKDGFKSKGTVKNVNKYSTLSGLDFKLEQIYSSIKGTLTNGINPLENIKITLINLDNNSKTTTLSSQNGSFQFDSVPILNTYTIEIDNKNYTKYINKKFSINNNEVKIFNILLKDNKVKIILELKNSDENPLSNTKLKINNKEYTSDINGIVEYSTINNFKDLSLKIQINKYKFDKNILIKKEEFTNLILKKSIIIGENLNKEKININSTTNSAIK
ncbi:carboxypeptidase-like regulatory domain-containing protein [Haliovirga abyssi]|uniref:Carboxypeptidase regulatory-like domain-containing protein n=1 Tax=Haliovirga abyssi TaxID=2996794 RepID=A0AAU9DCC1_9FUSO|nr:carboxypeptidase regulatory-like domain-containing protein [Haliovirga abyssi]BDU49793.1 hypothetical protein HLVA_03620 [Haliovirga abyssi]